MYLKKNYIHNDIVHFIQKLMLSPKERKKQKRVSHQLHNNYSNCVVLATVLHHKQGLIKPKSAM